MHLHFLAEADFVRPTVDDPSLANESTATSRIRAYFHTRSVHVSILHHPLLNIAALVSELNNAVEQFTCHCSCYVLVNVTRLTLVMVPFHLMGGSSYFLTPRQLPLNIPSSTQKTLTTTCASRALFLQPRMPIASTITSPAKMPSTAALSKTVSAL